MAQATTSPSVLQAEALTATVSWSHETAVALVNPETFRALLFERETVTSEWRLSAAMFVSHFDWVEAPVTDEALAALLTAQATVTTAPAHFPATLLAEAALPEAA